MGKVRCGYCKAMIEEGSRKCPSCGKEFSYWKKETKAEPDKPKNPESRKAFWWMISALPVYILLMFAGQWILKTSTIIYYILTNIAYFYGFLLVLRWLSIRKDLPKQDTWTALKVSLIFLLITAVLLVISLFVFQALGLPNLATIGQQNSAAVYKALVSNLGKLGIVFAANFAVWVLLLLLVYPFTIKGFYKTDYKTALVTYVYAWLIMKGFVFVTSVVIGIVTAVVVAVTIAHKAAVFI